MIVTVFSDTHGNPEGMVRAVEAERPDALMHLGDMERDLNTIRSRWPELPVCSVSGNCDYCAIEPDTAHLTLENVKILATHGHRYGVKMSLDPLMNAAYFSGAKLVLFGHTHIPYNKEELSIRILNPGSAGLGARRTYGVLQLEKGMVLSAVIKPIPDPS